MTITIIQSIVTPAAATITAIAQFGGMDIVESTGLGKTILDELPAHSHNDN